MSRTQKFVLAGIAVIVAVALAVLFAPGAIDDKPKSVAGKAAPPKSAPKTEPQFQFNAETSKKHFAERSSVALVSKPAGGGAYGYADVTIKGDEAIAAFFGSLHGGNPAGLVLTATVSIGERSLPAMPILAAARGKDGILKVGYRLTTEDSKPVSPAFALDGRKATVSLSVGYLESAVADEAGLAAAEVAAAMDGAPLWPGPEGTLPGAKAFGTAAETFAGRFLTGAKERIDPLAVFEVGGADGAKSASVTLKDPAGGTVGEIGLSLATHEPMLPATADFRNVATMTVGPGSNVGNDLIEHPIAPARVLLGPGETLADACRELAQGLQTRLGLAAVDAARVADAVAGIRDRLGLPGSSGCGGPRATAKGFTDVGAMNRTLDRLTGAMRSAAPTKIAERFGALFAADMTLADFSRLWLPGAEAGLIEGPAHVAPSVEPGIAAELLAGLPIARIGCYGAGQGAGHRAALVELARDSGLWLLDLGFDAKGKIDAVVFRAAQQADLCRAAGSRKSGPGACSFAAPGRAYRGLDPGRC